MTQRARRYCFHAASALALALVVAGCTKGGQFDPTELFNSDLFDTKKKLKGERAPVFPEGVPGATTGVPPDLVKGYQPPPEPQDADVAVPGPTPPATAAETTNPKPKPKPKPKLAAQKPPAASGAGVPASASTRISVGSGQKSPAGQPDASQTAWPAPPPTGSPQQAQSAQPNWPAPPQSTSSPSGQSSQSIWPNPPSAGSSR
jgi:hypothetical protein